MTFEKTKVYPPSEHKPYWLIRYPNGIFQVFHNFDGIPLSLQKKINHKEVKF